MTRATPAPKAALIPWVMALLVVFGWNAVAPPRPLAPKRAATPASSLATVASAESPDGVMPLPGVPLVDAAKGSTTPAALPVVRLGLRHEPSATPFHLHTEATRTRAPPRFTGA